jgi:hypothetical protein
MRKCLRLALLCQMCFLTLIAPSTFGQADTPTHWRFAHFAAGVSAVDVQINGQSAVLQGVEFSGVSGWQEVPPGTYEIIVINREKNETLLSLSLVLSAGQWITLAMTVSENELTGTIIEEDLSPVADGDARLTVFYALPDVPVDILANGTPIFENIPSFIGTPAAPMSSPATTIELDAAAYDIHVSGSDTGDVLIDAGTIELLPGRGYLAAAINTVEDPRLVVVETNIAGNARQKALLRVAHLSSGTPPLDVYLDGELSVHKELSFPEFSQWIALPAGEITLAVSLSGETLDQAVIPPFELALAANTCITVAVIGALANDTLEAHMIEEDYSPLAPGFVRVNVLNAHPGAGPIDIQRTDGSILIEALGYPGFFGGNSGFNHFITESGTYDLRVRQSETDKVIFDLPGTNLFEGRNYFISVISANPPFIVTFSDIQEIQALLNPD